MAKRQATQMTAVMNSARSGCEPATARPITYPTTGMSPPNRVATPGHDGLAHGVLELAGVEPKLLAGLRLEPHLLVGRDPSDDGLGFVRCEAFGPVDLH